MDFYSQFRQFIENALDPIIGINEDGRIQSLNRRAEEIFGWSKSEAIGRSFVETLIISLQQSAVIEELSQFPDYRENAAANITFETIVRRRNTTQFPAEISLTPIRIQQSYILYAFIKDISQKKESLFEIKQSEAKYRQMVENIKDYAIFMLDRSGIIVSWNKGAERIKGYKSEEIIGKHFSIFYLKEDVEAGKIPFELKVAIADGKYEEENWRVRKDGTLFWANVLITPLWDENGQLQGFAKVARDLTARKQAEEALKQFQERYRLLIENIKDYAIFMLDNKGRISSWNKGAERITGYSLEEVIGEPFSLFYPEETLKSNQSNKCKNALKAAFKKGRSEETCWLKCKDHSQFYANCVISPLVGEAGQPPNFSVIIRDLSNQKER